MTPIVIPVSSGDGPSGPLTTLPAFIIGAVLLVIGVMMCAMVWSMRDILDDTIADSIIWWCMVILVAGLALSGLGFIVFAAWGVIT